MTKTLITGANQGLGLHTARRLVALGHEVWVTARDPMVGAEAPREIGAHFVQLDVTDDASILAASRSVAKRGGVDVDSSPRRLRPSAEWTSSSMPCTARSARRRSLEPI